MKLNSQLVDLLEPDFLNAGAKQRRAPQVEVQPNDTEGNFASLGDGMMEDKRVSKHVYEGSRQS